MGSIRKALELAARHSPEFILKLAASIREPETAPFVGPTPQELTAELHKTPSFAQLANLDDLRRIYGRSDFA